MTVETGDIDTSTFPARCAVMMTFITFANGSVNIFYSLTEFLESNGLGYLPEALSTQMQTVLLDMCVCSTATSTFSQCGSTRSFDGRIMLFELFILCWFALELFQDFDVAACCHLIPPSPQIFAA
jgi:hypothetical protein